MCWISNAANSTELPANKGFQRVFWCLNWAQAGSHDHACTGFGLYLGRNHNIGDVISLAA
jgi:hypothetical protein